MCGTGWLYIEVADGLIWGDTRGGLQKVDHKGRARDGMSVPL